MVKSIKILKMVRDRFVETNEEFLDTTTQILEDGVVICERKFAFPLGASEKEIETELLKVLDTYYGDLAIGEKTKKVEADEKKSDETINNLVGKQFNG